MIHASTVIAIPDRMNVKISLGTIAAAQDPERVGRWFVASFGTYVYEGDSVAEAKTIYKREVDAHLNELN